MREFKSTVGNTDLAPTATNPIARLAELTDRTVAQLRHEYSWPIKDWRHDHGIDLMSLSDEALAPVFVKFYEAAEALRARQPLDSWIDDQMDIDDAIHDHLMGGLFDAMDEVFADTQQEG